MATATLPTPTKFTGIRAADHPDVIAARARADDLRRRLGEAEHSIERARRDWHEESARSTGRAARAQALAAGRPAPLFVPLPENMAHMRDECETLKAAVELAEHAHREALLRANEEIRARLGPVLAEHLKRQHAALKALAAALDEANALRVELQAGGTALQERILYLSPEQVRATLQALEADARSRFGLKLS